MDDLNGDLENEEDVFIAPPDPIKSEFGGLPSKEAYVFHNHSNFMAFVA